jgi:hypothetical protein
MEGEESPLALILCAEKSSETIELLELDSSGIHVEQYLTQMPPKEVFEEKLHKAIQRPNHNWNREDRAPISSLDIRILKNRNQALA